MAGTQDVSLEDKEAFFSQLVASTPVDESEETTEYLADDARHCSRRFFQPDTSTTPAVARAPSANTSEWASRWMKKLENTIPDSNSTTPAAQKVVKGTPVHILAQKGRLARALQRSESSIVIGETPRELKAATATGDKNTTPKRRVSAGDSPSGMIAAAKRRKRGATADPKARPEEEQVLRGLRLYYVPDNDVAPLRRMRISKAKEFGAQWTRDVAAATHVVVDKHIGYEDLASVLARVSRSEPPRVVNEDFPLDCIHFRVLLNPLQKKYLLRDQPVETMLVGSNETAAAVDKSNVSLVLKSPTARQRRRDFVSPEATPPRPQDLSAVIPNTGLQTRKRNIAPLSDLSFTHVPSTGVRSTARVTVTIGKTARQDPGLPLATGRDENGDELTGLISFLQEYRDLPLDEEDDGQSSKERDLDDTTCAVEDRSGSEEDLGRQEKTRQGSTHLRRKKINSQDRFVCHRGGLKDDEEDGPNARTIEVLQQMADYYDRTNDRWRLLSYRKAITVLKRRADKITTAEQAVKLPGVGQRLAQKIEEIVTTNRLRKLDCAMGEPNNDILQLFMGIYGVGSTQAQQWISQGFRTLEDLKQRAKLSTNQRIGVDHYDDLKTRIPRSEMKTLGEVVRREGVALDPSVEFIIGGSYRRGAESSHDIDFVVTKPSTTSAGDLRPFLTELIRRMEAKGFLVARLASSRSSSGDGGTWHGCCVLPRPRDGSSKTTAPGRQAGQVWRRIDFLLVPASELGAALIYFTGNDIFNRSMRLLASKRGMKLNQRGLYRNATRPAGGRGVKAPAGVLTADGEVVEARDERRIFEILGVKWREPQERWC